MPKMTKRLLLILSFAVICIVLTKAQGTNCKPNIIPLRRGQRFCQLNCPPRLPRFLCVTATKDIRLPACPHRCCRSGNICVPIRRPG